MGLDLPLCSEEISEILQIIIANEKFQNPTVTFESDSKVDVGLLGISSMVKISDSNKTLHLFIKAAPKQIAIRKAGEIRTAYNNEFHFYETIYTTMKTFYEEKTGKSLRLVPKLYAASMKEMTESLAFENLNKQGFVLNGKANTLSREQTSLIFKEYGRFHGISFALKDQQEQLFTDLSENLTPLLHLWFDSFKIVPTVRSHCETMEKYLQSVEDVELLEKVKYFSENLENFLSKFQKFNSEHRVILHGDPNNGNMLFRNQGNNLELRLIDFQGANLNSPMMDIAYVFYGFASSEDNLAEMDFFLNTYYDSLSKTVSELGSDPETLCPFSVIKEHWKFFSVFGLIIGFVTIGMITNYAEVAVNLTGDADTDAFDFDSIATRNEKEYARRIKYLIKHFVDKHFI